jgi:mannose-6-phosphate isomerase-like protein (cupin superfamily)
LCAVGTDRAELFPFRKENVKTWITIIALALAPSLVGFAQLPGVDHTTQSQLVEKEKELKQTASKGNGSAAIKVSDYPNHYTMLSYRGKSGGGEIHEKFADFFYVVHGSATLLTGGKLVNPAQTSPGEIRGSGVEGGTETPLHEGDFVHIPANVPHQLVLADGQDFYYFVIKVREQQ